MAVGRTESGHGPTGVAGQERQAREGYYGRLAPPPPGAIYIRDPAAARAKAIREQYDLFVSQGREVPPHLQTLYDELDVPESDLDVDLVDAVTGEQLAEVDVVEEAPAVAKFTPVSQDMPAVTALPEPAPEPVAVSAELGGGGGLAAQAEPEPEPAPEPQAAPEPAKPTAAGRQTARKTVRR